MDKRRSIYRQRALRIAVAACCAVFALAAWSSGGNEADSTDGSISSSSSQSEGMQPGQGNSEPEVSISRLSSGLKLVTNTPDPTGQLQDITWILAREPRSIDIDKASGGAEGTVLANVCDRLFQIQPNLSTKPYLAKSVNQPSPTKYVIELRRGVRFHSGNEMTAQDVVWSMKRHAKQSSSVSDAYEGVKSIKKLGKYSLAVELKKPNSLFIPLMAGDGGIIYDKQFVKSAGQSFGTPNVADACTGPYTVAKWNAGSSMVLKQDKTYWNDAFTHGPKTVKFIWREKAAKINALKTGAADGAYLFSPALVTALKGQKDLNIYYGPNSMVYSATPTDGGALANPKLRTALSLAINRRGIAKAAFRNLAQPWKVPVGPATWGAAPDLFRRAYQKIDVAPASPSADDIARAKKLVQDAGIPDDPIVVVTDGSAYRNIMANEIVQAAQKIGLSAEIKTMSPAAHDNLYVDKAARNKVDIVIVGWGLGYVSPLQLYDDFVSGSFNNWLGFSSKKYDGLMQKAFSTAAPKARAQLVLKVRELFLENMLRIPLIAPPNTLVMDSKITGAPASLAYTVYPWVTQLGTTN